MSVYQTNGKPLSKQALYQQKLKQGVYHSPGKPSVGVASSASDAAALLAASSDLTVKPSYERLNPAVEAHSAALAAKKDSVPAWSRDGVDPASESAASVAGSLTKASQPKADLGIPSSYDRGSIYKQATANSSSTMTSRTTPKKSVSKHGLYSEPAAAAALDIAKISQAADKNSSNLINKRFNPDNDYRSGVHSKPADLTPEDGKLAAQSAGKSLTMTHGGGYTNSVSSQKRNSNAFSAADVVDATLLAAASAKAKERLGSINSTTAADLKQQAQLYSKALAAAHKNSEERMKSHSSGMIDLGGGLSLPASEIDKLATLIVQPVLTDLHTKAEAQRQSDQKQQAKQSELKKLHQKFKRDDENQKRSEKVQRLKEKEQRIAENEERKKQEDEKFATHQTERNTEVEEKQKELDELKQKHASEKEALLQEKKEKEDEITEEETGLKNERKEELEKMQKEKDEILKPTLDELKVEKDKLKELTDSKDQLQSEVDSGEKLKKEYEDKIAELKEKLESTKSKISTATEEHNKYKSDREATDKEVFALSSSHIQKIEDTEKEHKKLNEEIENLNKEKDDHVKTKADNKKEIVTLLDERVKQEHAVQKELPEHMRTDVDEDKIRDTGSLFSHDEKVEKKVKKLEKADKEEQKEAKKEEFVEDAKKTAQGVKKSLDPKPTAEEKKAPKKGLRNRLSVFKQSFKTPKAEPAKTQPATVASTLGKEEKKTQPKASAKAEDSAGSNFDEEISIRESKNKGGLFKEEI